MVSGSGYTLPSRLSSGGDSGWRVVEEETESSMSEVLDGVGEFALSVEFEVEVVRSLDLIFCVIRV
jgi:hypothetical protein